MKIGNKIMAMLLATATAAFGFTGCGAQGTGGQESAAPDNGGEALKIVTTVFPEYDWVKEILGDKADKAELTLLLDNGVDLHSYQPTAEDIAKISECDLFIYVGGESDGWVEDALAEAKDRDIRVVNLMETLGDSVKEEEVVEGMEAEEEEESEEAEEEEGPEYDEHVWLSLKNAQILVNKIAEEMGAADADNADVYKANAKAYSEKLAELDSEYKSVVDAAPVKTLLFGDRFPFRYMVDDYGLDYYAAFVGCSAETEASFETVVFLAGKVDELGLGSVLTIESSDGRIAQTIIDNTSKKDQQVLTLDSMQSTTSEDVEKGASYLAIMKSNLEVLKAALK